MFMVIVDIVYHNHILTNYTWEGVCTIVLTCIN